MEKFNPDCGDVPSDGFSATITNELKFLENLKYWQVVVNEYKTIYLKCLDSERYIEFFEFLRVPESIFLTYDWATPECWLFTGSSQTAKQHDFFHRLIFNSSKLMKIANVKIKV
jgi:hypothetical protein